MQCIEQWPGSRCNGSPGLCCYQPDSLLAVLAWWFGECCCGMMCLGGQPTLLPLCGLWPACDTSKLSVCRPSQNSRRCRLRHMNAAQAGLKGQPGGPRLRLSLTKHDICYAYTTRVQYTLVCCCLAGRAMSSMRAMQLMASAAAGEWVPAWSRKCALVSGPHSCQACGILEPHLVLEASKGRGLMYAVGLSSSAGAEMCHQQWLPANVEPHTTHLLAGPASL